MTTVIHSPQTFSATTRRPLRRLFVLAAPLSVGVYLVVGALPNVLLPLQVEHIDEASKASNLALVTGIGAAVAMVVSPIAGMISDRTRSRFGRRAPWMVVGALSTGMSLVGMGFASGLVQLIVAWSLTQFTLNLLISPMTAILPDRVPVRVRGVFATVVGVGTIIGNVVGQAVGARLSSNIHAGYLVLAGLLVVVVCLFVVFTKDASSAGIPREEFSWRVFLATFWVSPRKHPDFAWGFLNRLLLYTGFFLITGYQLYILQDYIGLGDDAVNAIPLLGAVMLVAVLISATFCGPLSDRSGRRKPFVVGAGLLMAAALIIPFFAHTLTGMVVYMAVAATGFGLYMAVDSALMSQVLPVADNYGKDLGVLNIAATLPQTIAPFLGGIIVVSFGYQALFPVALALTLAGTLAVLPIKAVR
jgi:MFS family permease